VPHGKVWVDPALPQAYADLRLEDVALGDRRLTIDVRDGTVSTSLTSPRGTAESLSVLHEPRPPMAAPR
jgi:hypothetical protein